MSLLGRSTKRSRWRRQLSPTQRARVHATEALWRGLLFLALVCICGIADTDWWLALGATAQPSTTPPTTESPTTLQQSYSIRRLSHNVSEYTGNKAMNFPVRSVLGVGPGDSEWYETGDEPQGFERRKGQFNPEQPYIASNGKEYFERRWAFSWGVDLTIRFKKGYQEFCTSTLLLPAENAWPNALRGFLYVLFLIYIFLGVAIVSDVFMSGIEKITALREREVETGEMDEKGQPKTRIEQYEVWNGTVANLTLLALGSSAPEILLSLIETISTLDQPPGELGPSTIVGSASFNLLVITAVCMMALEEPKKVDQLGVFIITSVASIFAYIWLLLVLNYWTPDVITIYEAVATFLFFPILVGLAYGQDVSWCRKGGEEGLTKPDSLSVVEEGAPSRSKSIVDREQLDEAMRREIQKAKKEGEPVTADSIAHLVTKDSRQRLNRGHYRINAIRSLMAKQTVIREMVQPPTPHVEDDIRFHSQVGVAEFDSPNYACLESQGYVTLRVCRRKGRSGRLQVNYHTQDLTAVDPVHYQKTSGTVTFDDGDVGPKDIQVKVIDNEEQNEDRTFFCRLEGVGKYVGDCRLAVVRIIDDDHPGEPEFEAEQIDCAESDGKVLVHVLRHRGVSGRLYVNFETEDGFGLDAAKTPNDYEERKGQLVFADGEHMQVIEVPIVDDFDAEKSEHFFVKLTDAHRFADKEDKDGREGERRHVNIGKIRKVRINILGNPEVRALYDGARQRAQEEANVTKKIETHSWLEQFRGAMQIDSEEGEEPGAFALTMHFLTFAWKVIFAFIPPTEYGGGWWCFTVSLMFIGMIVYVVAEVAMLFGCSVGLAPPVTAITFVALGTSLPDTFASKTAAQQEDTADAAIGNVTGSNSVNVFLGLGLPWVVASVYYEAQGKCYILPAGSLAFSVLVFTVCAVTALCIIFGLRIVRGSELGGDATLRYSVSGVLVTLWILYIVLSSLHERTNMQTKVTEGYFAFPGTEARCPCSCPKAQRLDLLPAVCAGECGD